MQLKRILSIFLAAALTFSALVVPASAEPAEYLKVGVEAMTATPVSTTPQIFNQGDEVTVRVKISQNTGIIFLKFAVFFDTDAFEYVGYEDKNLIPNAVISEKSNYLSYFVQTTKATDATGDAFEITFKVKETFCGEANISAELWQGRPANCATDNGISSNRPVPFEGESVTLQLHNIDAAQGVVTAPTCLEEGYTTYTCSACENAVVGNIVPANGHTPAEVVVENRVEPTCTVDGSYDDVVYCSVCEAELERTNQVIPMLGHTPAEVVVENRVEPTCTETGSYDDVVYCSVCNAELSREAKVIDALGHDLISHEAKAPTCTEIGWDTYDTCSRCNYTTYVEIDALGHKAAEAVVENRVEPTCTATGSYDSVVYCSVCKAELSREAKVIDALGHDLIAHEAKAPTCTEIGWDAYDTCSRCDYTTYVEKAALGHKAAEAVVENRVEPTCTATGSYDSVVYCSVCKAELSREAKVIDALGHDLIAHEAKAPTCTEIGWDAYDTCSRCDYTTYAEKAALGHDLIAHEAKAPTCTEIGWDAYDTCSRCDYTTYVEKAALGHKYGESTIIEPEYKQEGYTTHTCTVCGHVENYDVVPGLTYILGDTDGNEVIDSDDAINLLYYTLLPDKYSVNQKCDFNGDGVVNSDDAIYLLYFTLLPEKYPLHK